MACYECNWPKPQKIRGGGLRCPRCGTKAFPEAAQPASSAREKFSPFVKLYLGIFMLFALLSPFFTPLLIKISLANP